MVSFIFTLGDIGEKEISSSIIAAFPTINLSKFQKFIDGQK